MEKGLQILTGIASFLFIPIFYLILFKISDYLGKAKDWIKRMIFIFIPLISQSQATYRIDTIDYGSIIYIDAVYYGNVNFDPDIIIIGEPDEEPASQFIITAKSLIDYEIQCHNDSTYTKYCEIKGQLWECADLSECRFIGGTVVRKWKHKEPTFIGFINWIKSKL